MPACLRTTLLLMLTLMLGACEQKKEAPGAEGLPAFGGPDQPVNRLRTLFPKVQGCCLTRAAPRSTLGCGMMPMRSSALTLMTR